MRIASSIVLVAALAACGGPADRQSSPDRDASADVAPPAPFVPYMPGAPGQAFPPASGGGPTGAGTGGAAGMFGPGPGAGATGGVASLIGAGGMGGPGMAAGGQGGFGGPGGPGGPDAGFGAPPPPLAFCDSLPKRPLPYFIATDFTSRLVLRPDSIAVIDPPNCNQTLFPDAAPTPPPEPDAGVPGANDPPASAVTCSAFKYDPDACVAINDPMLAGQSCWAGVLFTPTPAGPMGPGICIEPGAIAVHFKARASKDNARVKFGSIREGLSSTEFYLNITRVWRSYTVMIPAGEDYNSSDLLGGVWNGFSVVVEPQDHAGGTYVFVADVIWARQ